MGRNYEKRSQYIEAPFQTICISTLKQEDTLQCAAKPFLFWMLSTMKAVRSNATSHNHKPKTSNHNHKLKVLPNQTASHDFVDIDELEILSLSYT